MGDIPNTVQQNQTPGIPGDFCDANARFSAVAGQGQYVAGVGGVNVGSFVWADSTGTTLTNSGSGTITGFVAREQQALIQPYLGEYGVNIPAGFPVTAYTGGGFWMTNSGTAPVTIGMKAYANYLTGAVTFAKTGSPTASGTVTASIASATATFTAAIAAPVVLGNAYDNASVMTVSATSAGTLFVGGTLTGLTGIVAGTTVVGIGSWTSATGTGTVFVSPAQSCVSSTGTETGGLATVTATGSGSLSVGSILSGTGVTAGTTVTQLATYTSTAGTGTVYVNASQTASSTSVTATGNVETKWEALSIGVAGDPIKTSSFVTG